MTDPSPSTSLLLGRLDVSAIPFHEPILLYTFAMVALLGAALLGAITYFGLWGRLWRDWFTSIDHKRIGIMYMVLGLVMLLRGFFDAVMLRLQQAIALGGAEGYLPPHHYDQIFTAHGVIMIFFVSMPLVTGLMNYVVPLQIGARDVAFPFLNNLSFWMTVGGAVLVMMSLFVGEFARTGGLAYPPLSNLDFSPGVGVDYYIWFFGITTMIISIPTGAKIFNWLFTMYRGRIRFELPMMWTVAFMVTFVIGGMTGVLLAVPPADFVLHNSLFLVSHFHVIIGGVLFGLFAGINYWFPKAFGYRLDPFWGKCSFWLWVVGFYFAIMPGYVLGLMGVTRRMSRFEDPAVEIWFRISALGTGLIALGIACFLVQMYVSFRRRAELADRTGDPWNGRTLEWSTASPPPPYNFAFTPRVHELGTWHDMKKQGYARPRQGYRPIHMPRNTWAGVALAGLSTFCGFALIWYMWMLAALSFLGLLIVAVVHTFDYQRDTWIPAEDVASAEQARTRLMVGPQ